MDGWVRVLRPFNSISVVSRRWKGEHERLCAMRRRLGSGRISPPAGFEPATPCSEVGSANHSDTRTLLIPIRWHQFLINVISHLSQFMILWYLSHRRPAKAQASLRICAVSPEPSLFAHMNYGSSRRVRPKIRHLASLDGCACVFEEWIYGGQKVPKSHELSHLNFLYSLHTYCFIWVVSRCRNHQERETRKNTG